MRAGAWTTAWLLAAVFAVLLLAGAGAAAAGGSAQSATKANPVPMSITDRLKNYKAPPRPSTSSAAAAVVAATTTAPKCSGSTAAPLTITMPSFDAAHPGNQDLVFFKETPDGNAGKATLWVAWDFMTSQTDPDGSDHVITCDQLAYLQGQMDHIVDSDVKYFGAYQQRPAGNENIDVMIYNVVDESSFDPAVDSYIAGFFWDSVNDQFNRNMIFVDSLRWQDYLGPDAPVDPNRYEGTTAHELQHLIHNDHDADEDSWVDEGMADLAAYLAGYGYSEDHVVYYLAFHRTPLTTWSSELEHYGASLLFQAYLLENFGGTTDASKAAWLHKLIDEQQNSIAGVEAATGASFKKLFDSWMLANYLDDLSKTGPGGYPLGYRTIELTPFVSRNYTPWSIRRAITEIYGAGHGGNLPIPRIVGGGLKSGKVEFPVGEAPSYAAYYGLYKGVQPTLDAIFTGAAQSGVAPAEGSYEVFSGSQNLLTDRMLQLNVPVGDTLTFKTWYDLENEWDYGFVEVSTDNGSTWAPLKGSITRTSTNPNGSTAWENSLLGAATSSDAVITGNSGGWVNASFDLPAASNVLVRIAYYTDEGTLGQGWFVDDVHVTTAAGTFEPGFEAGTSGWTLGGWTRTTGLFQNDWSLSFVNPLNTKSSFVGNQFGYVDNGTLTSTGRERLALTLDTSRLYDDSAMVAFANRSENPFGTPYTLLVSKGSSSSSS
jgi:hypothetical protein